MSTESTQLAVSQPVKASDQLAAFLGIEKGMMLETLKAQCFKGKRPEEVTDMQLAAFVSTANVLQVNPLVPGMLYAYPERNGGITPILGPDGTFKKLDEFIASGKLIGFDCEVVMVEGKPDHANAIIYRSGDLKPAKYTAYFSEWNVGSNPNWQTRPRHMLWVRAIKQAARQVIHGLPMDADEYQISQMTNVTPEEAAPAPARPAPPERKKKGAASVAENVQEAEVVTQQEPAKIEKLAEKLAQPAEVEKVAAVVQSFEQAAKATATPEQIKAAEELKNGRGNMDGDSGEPYVAPTKPFSEPTPQPRAFLQDGEKLEAEISVSEVAPLNITTADGVKPSVKARVKGGYVGEIYHVGGGTPGPDGRARVAAPWEIGASLRVVLLGRKNNKAKNEDGTLGKVQVFVQAVEISEEGMEA